MKKLKKIFAALIIASVTSSVLFAGILDKKRHVEFSTNIPVDVSNTGFGISDIFQETVVIDFNKIARDLPTRGLVIDYQVNPDFCFGLNIGNLSFHSHIGVDTYGYVGLSKDIFTFLAEGNGSNSEMYFGGSSELEAFVYTGISFGMETGKLKFSVSPQFFIPAIHIKPNKLGATVKNGEDGSFSVEAVADVDIYSVIDIGYFFQQSSDLGLSKIMSALGFDIGGQAEYQILPFLKAGGYVNCPIVPGTLNYSANIAYSATASTNDGCTIVDVLMGFADGTASEKYSLAFEQKPNSFISNAGFKLNRPFRLGGTVEYSPFGSWFNVQGMLGVGIKQPFTSYATPYLEYSAGLNINWCRVFEVTVSSSCIKEVYRQSLDFIMNLWLFELDFGVSLTSTSFLSSWCGRGVGAYVAVTIGA